MEKKILQLGLVHAFGVLVYVGLISWLLQHGEKLFGHISGWVGPAAMLLLFVLSAAVTSLLVFGRPVYLYFNNAKVEAVKLLLSTVGWLGIITLLIFLTLALV
jgi:hypothetical protein